MFKSPFSFSGRIRRTEYGLSYLIFIFCFYASLFLFSLREELFLIVLLFIAVLYWFLFAQGAKRCHDLGNSGFYQLIPFYGLWIIFEDGNRGVNRYGEDPKATNVPETNQGTSVLMDTVVLDSKKELAFEILCGVLFNVLLIALSVQFIAYPGAMLLLAAISVIITYGLLLTVSNYRHYYKLHNYVFKHRLIYSVFVYIILRGYQTAFRNIDFDTEEIIAAPILILFFWGMTYISKQIYGLYVNKISNAKR